MQTLERTACRWVYTAEVQGIAAAAVCTKGKTRRVHFARNNIKKTENIGFVCYVPGTK